MPCVFSKYPKSIPQENIVLGILELSSISKGIKILDTIVKKAPIKVIEAKTISPGHYIILFTGEVAEVEESLESGKIEADSWLIDKLFIPNLHNDIIPAMLKQVQQKAYDSIAVLEGKTVASIITSADMACKEAEVQLIELRLADGLGGKSYFVISGELYNIQASIEKALTAFKFNDNLLHYEIISSFNDEVKNFI